MSERPQAEMSKHISADGTSSITRLALVWSERLTNEILFTEIGAVVREGVRKHLLEDPEFRVQVSEAIKAAAASMPLEEITKAVKQAIKESTENV